MDAVTLALSIIIFFGGFIFGGVSTIVALVIVAVKLESKRQARKEEAFSALFQAAQFRKGPTG